MTHFLTRTASSSSSPLSLLLLISFFGFIIPSCCQLLYFCSEQPSNETAHTNLNSEVNDLLDSLSSKASSLTFDIHVSNGIYGLFLCRGDVSSQNCSSCVRNASQQIKDKCSSRPSGITWFDNCMLSYSDKNFLGILEMSPTVFMLNTENKTSADYNVTANTALLNSIIKGALTEDLRFKYHTVNASGSGNPIYGMAQCTRDIGKPHCEICLNSLLTFSNICCRKEKGWRILAPKCYLRYESYPFIESDKPGATPPSLPAPPPDEEGHAGGNRTRIIVISISSAAAAAILLGLLHCSFNWRNKRRERDRSEELPLQNLEIGESVHLRRQHLDATNQESDGDMHYFSLSTLKVATDGFSDANKLGEGGFGPVYKGKLMSGEEIAVKRLSIKSSQGHEEFENEAKVILKLQHKNLVRLLGCCVNGDEKLLVYEYMPNTSLDAFLFDPLKCKQLDWLKRKNIVNGIARGILYLHEDSRLKIIHRDLKASNILLDEEMNPKISDFGTARIFGGKQIDASTDRIVGTYGYMAPEYAMEGLFSVKSDVYSFGVIMLEVMSGRKSIGFLNMDRAHKLISYAWELWSEGRAEEMVDKNLAGDCPPSEAVIWIHIALLCVQEDPNIRPTMSTVVLMLRSRSTYFPQPSKPPFLSAGGVIVMDQEASTTEIGTEFPTTNQTSTSASTRHSIQFYV